MFKNFSIKSKDIDNLSIRSISHRDIELLRTWKNEHRNSFFFQKIITPEMQDNWFQSYAQKNDDFMMIILQSNQIIGCIGFRLIKDKIDVYNVILGQKEFTKKGLMANALKLVCKEAMRRYPKMPIMASVIKTNPALQWYLRRGFVISDEYDEHYDLIYPESKF